MSDDFPAATAHDPPTEVLPDVWMVRGTLVRDTTTFTRNMVLLRHGGELTVINTVRLDDGGERRLEQLGRVAHLVKLGAFHGLDDPYYRSRYPDARFWAPPGSAHKRGIHHDDDLTEQSAPPVPGLGVFSFRNTRLPEAALHLPVGGGTLITCDAATAVRDLEGTRGMERILTAENGFLRPVTIGLMWRNGMARDPGPSLLPDFQRLLELDFGNLLTAHGPPVLGNARDELRETVRIVFGVRRWPARVQ
ncbi:MAG TPA: hypothetical protein VL172_10710 [Kofleriaceae bacterium]|nr:hypothetical protein [Kofleriaceae bacterium]